MTKREEINNPRSCLNRASDDEMVFVLRAQDKLAPILVRQWAQYAEEAGCPPGKIAEARACADAMERWPTLKYPD